MSSFADLLALHGEEEATCTCRWVGKQLGHEGSDAALVAYVEELIAGCGFPRPLPHRKHGGGLATCVHVDRSRWIRAGVLDWLTDFLPPSAAAALDNAARERAADEMDAAAGNLRLVAHNDLEAA